MRLGGCSEPTETKQTRFARFYVTEFIIREVYLGYLAFVQLHALLYYDVKRSYKP